MGEQELIDFEVNSAKLKEALWMAKAMKYQHTATLVCYGGEVRLEVKGATLSGNGFAAPSQSEITYSSHCIGHAEQEDVEFACRLDNDLKKLERAAAIPQGDMVGCILDKEAKSMTFGAGVLSDILMATEIEERIDDQGKESYQVQAEALADAYEQVKRFAYDDIDQVELTKVMLFPEGPGSVWGFAIASDRRSLGRSTRFIYPAEMGDVALPPAMPLKRMAGLTQKFKLTPIPMEEDGDFVMLMEFNDHRLQWGYSTKVLNGCHRVWSDATKSAKTEIPVSFDEMKKMLRMAYALGDKNDVKVSLSVNGQEAQLQSRSGGKMVAFMALPDAGNEERNGSPLKELKPFDGFNIDGDLLSQAIAGWSTPKGRMVLGKDLESAALVHPDSAIDGSQALVMPLRPLK